MTDCDPVGRRLAAALIDVLVVSALFVLLGLTIARRSPDALLAAGTAVVHG